MTVTVRLWRPSMLGFDLDTIRPCFENEADRDAYFDKIPCIGPMGPIVWRDPGDPIIVNRYYGIGDAHCIGCLNCEWEEHPDYKEKYYFVTQSVKEVGDGKTQLNIAIDWELTRMITYDHAYISRCPLGVGYARSQERGVVRYRLKKVQRLLKQTTYILVLSSMKLSPNDEKKLDGPVYVALASQDDKMPYDTIDYVLSERLFTETDILGAYMAPDVVDVKGSPAGWMYFPPSRPREEKYGCYVQSRSKSYLAGERVALGPIKTDLNEGLISGFCDIRGNILYDVPYGVSINTLRAHILLGIGSCTCYVELGASDESKGYALSQIAGLSFSITCPTLDLISDTWNEYAYRQREIDIRARSLGNIQGLISSTFNPVNIATSAMAGGPAGVAASIGGGIVNFGFNTYFGNMSQDLTDLRYKRAQNIVQVVGAGHAYDMHPPEDIGGLSYFILEADPISLKNIENENALVGVSAWGTTFNMSEELKSDIKEHGNFRPWAFSPFLEKEDISASEKDAIRATCSKGCRWMIPKMPEESDE